MPNAENNRKFDSVSYTMKHSLILPLTLLLRLNEITYRMWIEVINDNRLPAPKKDIFKSWNGPVSTFGVFGTSNTCLK